MTGRPFSEQDDRDLHDGRRAGFSWAEIAFVLDRTPSGCMARFAKLRNGATHRQQEARRRAAPSVQRSCLSCRSRFNSTGAGNRLCETCRGIAADSSPFEPD